LRVGNPRLHHPLAHKSPRLDTLPRSCSPLPLLLLLLAAAGACRRLLLLLLLLLWGCGVHVQLAAGHVQLQGIH
jgi:hypothetical protein